MKYFFIAVAFIIGVVTLHQIIVKSSPDMAKESGLRREVLKDATKQAQEDRSIWNTQRENRNQVPRSTIQGN